jgi:two-component system response regulator PilR (NtrC family)
VVASALGRVPTPASARAMPPTGQPRRPALQRLLGDSAAMQQVRSLVEKVARSMAPVLVHGESGTGKELVARAIHDCSARAGGPFVAVNCGAIPENLLEAEFFGYRKGAFTGANEDREGFFQAAQSGTLFLDEIGDLPLAMQSKLLRVIQERAVRPLGGTAEQPVNVRIVSATHRDLGAEVQAGRFRQDLFYRLNVIRIVVPPLRERLGDVPAICRAVVERIARDAGVSPPPTLALEAEQRLLTYAFPGNVRELENLLHRALALAAGPSIGIEDLGLPDIGFDDTGTEAGAPGWSGPGSAAPPVAPLASAPAAADTISAEPPLPTDLVAYLDEVERQVLQRALERHRYNRTAAGAGLGLSLRQMRYRMARLGIGGEQAAAEPDGN